jgi:hypothetical protein
LAPFHSTPRASQYCTAAQATTQIAAAASNPALNVIPPEFMDPASLKLMPFMDQPGDYFLDNGLVRNLFTLRQATQNETDTRFVSTTTSLRR